MYRNGETKSMYPGPSPLQSSAKASSQVVGVIGFLILKIGRAWGLNKRS